MAGGKVSVESDVVFGSANGRDLLADIYHPDGAPSPAPVVLMYHGGGWRRGDRSMMKLRAEALAAHGFVCIAAEYRLTGESPWPAQLDDVKTAIRWTRANAASLGVDPGQIALQGHSAGAHLSLLAAGTPDEPGEGDHQGVPQDVQAVVAFYPPVLFSPPGVERPDGALPAQMLSESMDADGARAASPIQNISAAFPPTMLLHGSADSRVPSNNSTNMYQALVEADVDVDLRLYAGLKHEFDSRLPAVLDSVEHDVAHFLRRVMVDPQAYEADEPGGAAQRSNA